jgi:hypothetical protein
MTVTIEFIFKSSSSYVHWDASGGYYLINMFYGPIFVYTIIAALFTAFITFLAFKHPRGPQPATWGSIQTLANLVDDWETDDAGRFWW